MNTSTFIKSLRQDIINHELILPTLPDVALRIRAAAEDDHASLDAIVAAIQTDPALVVRVLQIANSAVNRGASSETASLSVAVAKIGLGIIPHLVTGLVMGQLFHSAHPEIARLMRQTWVYSLKVANAAKVNAERYTKLLPEIAYTAGLIHKIGVLPILRKAELAFIEGDHLKDIPGILRDYHHEIGGILATEWKFPTPLKEVPGELLNPLRDTKKPIDYIDLLIVAATEYPCCLHGPEMHTEYLDMPAFRKLGQSGYETKGATHTIKGDS